MIRRSRLWVGVLALTVACALTPAVASATPGWSAQSIPTPASAFPNSLAGVSCQSAGACTAVGYRFDKSENSYPVAEGWNGSSWTLQSVPEPSGATSAQLTGVSCPAANNCLAVGNMSPGVQRGFIERWNGTSWTVGSVASISAGFELNGVSCFSANACTAVGDEYLSGGGSVPVAERWDGTSWSVQTMPDAPGGNLLYKVSCPSATVCVAVGQEVINGSIAAPFSEVWNGTSWTVKTTPNPGQPGTNTQLESVSCVSPTACAAVGGYRNTKGLFVSLAEGWNGSHWSVAGTPNPAKSGDSSLYDVSCSPDGHCAAVGTSVVGAKELPLIELYTGSGWFLSTPAAGPPGARFSALYGASCQSASSCTVVGEDISSLQTLAESYNGTSWTLQKTANATGPSAASMSGLSCSATACVAVGNWTPNTSTFTATLAELWNGTKWAIQKTVSPSGKTPTNQAIGNRILTAVSCWSATACMAVGYYADSGNVEHFPMAELWNGTSWTLETVPMPSGATYHGAQPRSVSCSSNGDCTAVGYSDVGTFAVGWDGTSWTLQSTPSPGGSSDQLSAVSCAAASDCQAVGDSLTNTGFATLAEHWDGTGWTVESTPTPSGATGTSILSGVSCTSAGACTAVGYYSTSSGDDTLAETWNGTSWNLQTTANSSSSFTNELAAVSCPAAGACEAVGQIRFAGALGEGWDGTAWTLQSMPGTGPPSLSGVSCSSSAACFAVGATTGGLVVDRYVVPPPVTLTVSPAGLGSGSVSGTGIACPPTCSASYAQGTAVTLTAKAAAGSAFTGWSGGACSGTGTCKVTLNANTTVTATFKTLPSCSNLTTKATAGAAGTVQLSCADPAGNTLTYAIVAGPAHGTLGTPNSSGQVSYTPTAAYSGPDTFTYMASASDGSSNTATVTITVSTIAPTAPSCSNVTGRGIAGTAGTVQLSCSDPGGGALSYAIVSGPAHGTLGTPNGSGQVTYTPSAGYSGPDIFKYKATASDGTSNTAAVGITVTQPG